jgi:hypothetical protein
MFAVAKLADMVNRVKPEGPRQRETRPAGLQISGFRMCWGATLCAAINYSNRPVRTRMPGGVGGEESKGSPLSRCDMRHKSTACVWIRVTHATVKRCVSPILGAFEEAQSELVGKAVVRTDGNAGTIENVWFDEFHVLRNKNLERLRVVLRPDSRARWSAKDSLTLDLRLVTQNRQLIDMGSDRRAKLLT